MMSVYMFRVFSEMELSVIIIALMPCLCAGEDVQLITSPSSVIEGNSLTLNCSMRMDDILGATFYAENRQYLGRIQLVEGRCEVVRNGICTQHCSCTKNGRSFSLTISNIRRFMDGIGFICFVKYPRPAYSSPSYVRVIYPPSAVWLSRSGNQTFVNGTNVEIFCQANGGNPLATLTWHCDGLQFVESNWTHRDVVVSSLSFMVDEKFDRRQCICTAEHQASPEGHFGKVAILFDILYKPIITLDQSVATIREGESFNRTCSAQGNPKPIIHWYHGRRHLTTTENLQFKNIDRTNAGDYACIAMAISHDISLQSTKSFNIAVQYGPDVDLVIVNTTENTTNLLLYCTANGVPPEYTYRWIHKIGSTVIRDTFDHVSNSGSVSTLTIPRVSYQDMGTYICEVENGYNGRDGQILQRAQGYMSVLGSPRAVGAQDQYVTENGAPLDISITYISFPEPVNTNVLRKEVSTVPPGSDLTVSVSPVSVPATFYNKDVHVEGYIVQIHFSKFETKHAGQYQLYVRNLYEYCYNFRIVITDVANTPGGAIIGAAAASSSAVFILVIVAVFRVCRKRRHHPRSKPAEDKSGDSDETHVYEEVTLPNEKAEESSVYAKAQDPEQIKAKKDGMKKNPLYESAGPYWSNGDAVVSKLESKLDVPETNIYDEVILPNDQADELSVYGKTQNPGQRKIKKRKAKYHQMAAEDVTVVDHTPHQNEDKDI